MVNIKIKLYLFVIFINLILSKEAIVSGTVPKESSLHDVISDSTYIVHVKKASPFQNNENELAYNFSVIKSLGRDSTLEAEKDITVLTSPPPRNIPEGKWAFEYFYSPSTSLNKENEFILFLTKDGDNYKFVVIDSYESVNKMEIIIKAINEQNL